MSFCTVINCLDGRVQLPVFEYLKNEFEADYVDTITEAGPVAILVERQNTGLADSILQRVDISVNKHKSVGIAVAAHYDCAGNPVSEQKQKQQLDLAVQFLTQKYPDLCIIGLWVDSDWQVQKP